MAVRCLLSDTLVEHHIPRILVDTNMRGLFATWLGSLLLSSSRQWASPDYYKAPAKMAGELGLPVNHSITAKGSFTSQIHWRAFSSHRVSYNNSVYSHHPFLLLAHSLIPRNDSTERLCLGGSYCHQKQDRLSTCISTPSRQSLLSGTHSPVSDSQPNQGTSANDGHTSTVPLKRKTFDVYAMVSAPFQLLTTKSGGWIFLVVLDANL